MDLESEYEGMGDITRVLMDSSNWVVVIETPLQVMAERSRAIAARFPSSEDHQDMAVLTAPAATGDRGKGSVVLDPTKIEGATLSII